MSPGSRYKVSAKVVRSFSVGKEFDGSFAARQSGINKAIIRGNIFMINSKTKLVLIGPLLEIPDDILARIHFLKYLSSFRHPLV